MKHFFILIILLLVSNSLFAQPANDDPCNATVLPVNASCVNTSGTNVSATASETTFPTIPAPGCASYSGGDVWFSITVPAGGDVIITADNNGGFTDGGMAAYSGTCGALNLITCNDDGGPGLHGLISLSGQTPGATIWIRYWEYGNNSFGTFAICASLPASPPANDDCSGAFPLTVNPDFACGNTTAGTVAGATASTQSSASCGGTEDDDVWFSFVATNTSHSIDILNASGSTTDMYHSLWSGTCPALTLVAGTCSDPDNQTVTGLTIGQTYYIRVYTWTSTTGQTTSFDVCVGVPPPPSSNQDCSVATPVCGNNSFSGNSNGFSTQELNSSNSGCLSIEHQSSWYTFTIQSSGTLTMDIAPNANDDYDFAIWGPNPNCSPTATPLRCSFAAGSGAGGSYNTGLGNGAVDNSESSSGDNWVAPLNVIAGEVYILLIDNFSASNNPFNLNWGGTSSLDCTILPVKTIKFNAKTLANGNKLEWITLTEIENDYFIIEKSFDGINYTKIKTIKGNGNSNSQIEYSFLDKDLNNPNVYYRLQQVDFNGEIFEIGITKIKRTLKDVIIYPNPATDELTFDFKNLQNGNYIIEYINLQGNLSQEVISLNNTTSLKSSQFYNLSNGLYLVRIKDSNNNLIKQLKVIKK